MKKLYIYIFGLQFGSTWPFFIPEELGLLQDYTFFATVSSLVSLNNEILDGYYMLSW